MKKDRYALWTNDVETTSIWFNALREETGRNVLNDGLPLLLDVYDEFEMKSTFFITGHIAELFPEIVKLIAERGHEVASHGLSHEKEHGFDVMNYKMQVDHLRQSKQILEDICGQEVISFRAPALRVNYLTGSTLLEAGYKIDSSVASQRFDFFFSFGSQMKLNWLKAPRKPYKADRDNIFRRDERGRLIEIPLSAAIIPYVGTLMRISPFASNLVRSILNLESGINRKPIVFDIHPNEFLDESNEPRQISRRSENILAYIMKDVLRSKLKTRNLGMPALELYRKQLAYFSDKGYKSCTLQTYCRELGLL